MKNYLVSIFSALMLIVTPQVALSDESSDKAQDTGKANKAGKAAGEAAKSSAVGGVSIGTIAAVAAIAAAAVVPAIGSPYEIPLLCGSCDSYPCNQTNPPICSIPGP